MILRQVILGPIFPFKCYPGLIHMLDLFEVLLGLPLPLQSWGSLSVAPFFILLAPLRSARPSHPHIPRLISNSISTCSVCPRRFPFVEISGQNIHSINYQ